MPCEIFLVPPLLERGVSERCHACVEGRCFLNLGPCSALFVSLQDAIIEYTLLRESAMWLGRGEMSLLSWQQSQKLASNAQEHESESSTP